MFAFDLDAMTCWAVMTCFTFGNEKQKWSARHAVTKFQNNLDQRSETNTV